MSPLASQESWEDGAALTRCGRNAKQQLKGYGCVPSGGDSVGSCTHASGVWKRLQLERDSRAHHITLVFKFLSF